MAVIGSATLNVVPKVEGGLANAINQEISKANVSGLGKSAGSGFMGGFASGAAIGVWSTVASKAIGAVTSSLGSAASRVDTLNNYPRIMESLGVASEDATASMQKMSTSLDNVPTRLDDMANTVQGIYAATMQYGTSLDTVTDAGLALNSMLLAGGQSQAVVTAAMEQFRQAVAKSKPDMQDWRSLMSAAPGQLDQLAKALVGPTAGALDLYAALGGGKESEYSGPADWGSISMGEFVEKLADMRDQFEGAATDAQGGISTSFANMTNAVTKGVANVLDAFGQERIASAIGDVKGLINDAFGRSDAEGLRAFAVEVAPLVSDAWDTMIDGAHDFEAAVGPSVGRVADALLSVAKESGPEVGDALSTVLESVAEAAPTVADTLVTVIGTAGEAIEGIAGIVSGVAPVVSGIVQDVLPVVGDVVEAIVPALPAIMVANTALGALSSVAGGLSAAGTGISVVAGALGTIGSVLPMVSRLADVGPALSLIAESGSLLGMSGVVGSIGGIATAIADVVPMIGGISDIGPALALVAESGGGLLAAINPLPVALGAAAAGIGYLGFQAYSAYREEKKFSEAIDGMYGTVRGMDNWFGAGAGSVAAFGTASADTKADVDGLVRAMEDYAKNAGAIHDAAYEEIGMLGQYKSVIDEAARATADGGELSAEGMAKLQWAVDGLNEAAGTHFTVEEVIAGSYTDEQGEIHNTIEAIDELIAKRQEEARTQALQETLTESYKVQQKAATELAEAQQDAALTMEVINGLMRDQNLTYEQAYDAVKKTGGANAENLESLERCTEAYDAATRAVQENERALGNAAEATASADNALAQWVSGHGVAAAAIDRSTMDLSELVSAMETAGVSTAALDSVGEAAFAQLAASCDGNVDAMVAALQVYNSQPIYEKDGEIHVDQSVLFDAEGNIYTWNGINLKDQYGRVIADDTELTDAYGNVLTWNKTEAKAINTKITNTSNPLPTLLGQLSNLASYNGMSVSTSVTNTTRNVTVNETQYKSSGSPTRGTVATGGHVVPRHASGYIAYGPTRTNFGLVGEDGVEAVYNRDDGTSDVYPLNNPRYLGYADPLADRIASAVSKSVPGGPTYIINGITVAPESAMARAMDATFDEARRYAGMGARR